MSRLCWRRTDCLLSWERQIRYITRVLQGCPTLLELLFGVWTSASTLPARRSHVCISTKVQIIDMRLGSQYRPTRRRLERRHREFNLRNHGDNTNTTRYYGNIAVAASVGNITNSNVSVANIPLSSEFESAYAIYQNEQLSKVGIVNLVEYNYTGSTAGTRPSAQYTLSVPSDHENCTISVQRLMANGSDAVTGISWDGISYNYELDNGKPVLLPNVTRGETVTVSNSQVIVDVPYSSFALLSFN